MPSDFSAESQISRRMDIAGYSADFLAAVARIPPTRLSQAFRGIKPLDGPQGLALLKLQDRLDELAKIVAPVPVSWKQPAVIRELLAALDDGRLKIAVIVTEPVIRQKAFSIQLKPGGDYFVGYKGKLFSAINFVQSQAITENVADELLPRLSRLGWPNCRKIENKFATEPMFEIGQVWHDESK